MSLVLGCLYFCDCWWDLTHAGFDVAPAKKFQKKWPALILSKGNAWGARRTDEGWRPCARLNKSELVTCPMAAAMETKIKQKDNSRVVWCSQFGPPCVPSLSHIMSSPTLSRCLGRSGTADEARVS